MGNGASSSDPIELEGGVLTRTGNLSLDGSQLWYSLDMEAGRTFQFAITSAGETNPKILVQVFEASKPEIPLFSSYGPYGTDKAVVNIPDFSYTVGDAGTYLIKVSDFDGNASTGPGAFDLSLDSTDDIGFGNASAREIAIGETVAATLSPSRDFDSFAVDLTAGRLYGFSAALDGGASLSGARIYLQDAAGNLVGPPTGTAAGTYSPVAVVGDMATFRPATSGRYNLVVADLKGDLTGSGAYTLTSKILPSTEIGVGAAGAKKILNGQSIASTLDMVADEDVFRVDAKKGVTYYASLAGVGTAVPRGELEVYDGRTGALLKAVVGSTANGGLTYAWKAPADGVYFVSVGLAPGQTVAGAYTLSVTSSASAVTGTNASEVLSGRQQANVLLGLGGNDLLNGGAGNDRVLGGLGNDTLAADAGNDTLDGEGGSDTLLFTGGVAAKVDLARTTAQAMATGLGTDVLRGIENVTGGSGSDRLAGSAVANVLIGGAGNDTLLGLAGNDVLEGGAGNDLIDGGKGTDTARFLAKVNHVVNLGTTKAQVTGEGTDRLIGIENVIAGLGNDRLTGSTGANVLSGGGGNDVLDGRAGNDVLDGGAGADTALYLAKVNHVINLSTTKAQVTGEGSDRLIGIENVIVGAGNDKLTGSTVANALTGGLGNDTLAGLAGDDRLNGGLGNDRIDGGTGLADVLVITGAVNNTVDLSRTTAQATGEGTDVILGIEWIEDLSGGNDVFTGNALANRFFAGLGNDVLNGGAGNDTLDGGVGNDRLTGGLGDDLLIGGAGADRFLFGGADGSDRITGFEDGVDVMELDVTTAEDVQIVASGTGVLVSYTDASGSVSVQIDGVAFADFTLGTDLLVV